MKKVYVVLQYNVESSQIKAICDSRGKAEKVILMFRDELVQGWKNTIDYITETELNNDEFKNEWVKKMNGKYPRMGYWKDKVYSVKDIEDTLNSKIRRYEGFIYNLKGNDWEKWNNGTEDCLVIVEHELI